MGFIMAHQLACFDHVFSLVCITSTCDFCPCATIFVGFSFYSAAARVRNVCLRNYFVFKGKSRSQVSGFYGHGQLFFAVRIRMSPTHDATSEWQETSVWRPANCAGAHQWNKCMLWIVFSWCFLPVYNVVCDPVQVSSNYNSVFSNEESIHRNYSLKRLFCSWFLPFFTAQHTTSWCCAVIGIMHVVWCLALAVCVCRSWRFRAPLAASKRSVEFLLADTVKLTHRWYKYHPYSRDFDLQSLICFDPWKMCELLLAEGDLWNNSKVLKRCWNVASASTVRGEHNFQIFCQLLSIL